MSKAGLGAQATFGDRECLRLWPFKVLLASSRGQERGGGRNVRWAVRTRVCHSALTLEGTRPPATGTLSAMG